MNNLKRILAVAIVTVFFIQCSSSKSATTTPKLTNQQKLDIIKNKYTQAQLDEGHTVWQASCGKCHKLYTPDSRDFDKWERVLPRMVKRSKLNDEDAGKVRAYILSNTQMN